MKNLIKKIFGLNGDRDDEAKKLRNVVLDEKRKDVEELKEINKRIKLSLKEGDIEVTIKNVKGVLDELK